MAAIKYAVAPEIVGDRTADGRLAIDIAEAGVILGISRSSAYAAANNGDLPTIRVGGRRLVPVKALQSTLSQSRANDV